MSKEVLAIVITVAIHLVVGGLLLWHLFISRDGAAGSGEDGGGWRDWWPRDVPPVPDPPSSGGPPPLADAAPARTRLRGPDRPELGGAESPERRPAHPREPAPAPAPPPATPVRG